MVSPADVLYVPHLPIQSDCIQFCRDLVLVPTYDANLQYQSQLLYDFGFVTREDPVVVRTLEEIRPETEKCLDVVREAWYMQTTLSIRAEKYCEQCGREII